MKKLIFKLSLFLSLLICVIIFSFLILSTVLSNKACFKLKKPVSALVLGNSHTEFALNDSIITDIENVSQSGESYFYTYTKLKNILDDNPQLKTVFLAFSNEVIDVGMNQWIWGDQFISFRFPKYSPFLDFQQHYVLGRNNPKSYFENLSKSIKYNSVKIFKNDYLMLKDNWGAFKNITQLEGKIEEYDTSSSEIKKVELSTDNLIYLDKIVELCEKNKIRLIFIRCPLHPKYQGYHNETILKVILKNRYSTIRFLDFAKFQLDPTDYFDKEHLNQKGAQKFSIWFEKNKSIDFKIK
ncbi:hypothetical protein MCERE19_03735 [Spirosomataceae bacterium]|jgi:hypothetical protein